MADSVVACAGPDAMASRLVAPGAHADSSYNAACCHALAGAADAAFAALERATEGGPWYLYEVDPSVTDEQRAKWNVPPLSQALARVDGMNAKSEAAEK